MHSNVILNLLGTSASPSISERAHYGAANAERGSRTLTSMMLTAAMAQLGPTEEELGPTEEAGYQL